jgi:hypothetical protein
MAHLLLSTYICSNFYASPESNICRWKQEGLRLISAAGSAMNLSSIKNFSLAIKKTLHLPESTKKAI